MLLAVLDLVGIIDPSGIADMLSASLYASQKDLIHAAINGIGIIPYLGDFAKTFRISKGGIYRKGTEGPHVDVFYSSPGHPQYEKAKFFLDGSLKQYKPIKK